MGRNGVSARRRLHGRLPRNHARDVRGERAMCGIAGFIATGSPYDPRAVVRRMVAALRHRGPDDEGEYLDEQAALGACRLSIVDLAGGRQPIGNETGTVHAVLNGEIYNFRELRARLQQRGHRFTTQSDTEVLVHAYEQDGEDFVADLDGMFALALWDGPARKLVLARDRMGEKRSEEHTSELQSPCNLVCRLLLEKKNMYFITQPLRNINANLNLKVA